MNAKLTVAVTVLGAQLSVSAPPVPASEPQRPNIVFILADDLGVFDLGCLGQQKIRTPQHRPANER